MNTNIRNTFIEFGKILRASNSEIENAINSAQHSNAWFTPEMVRKSIVSFGDMLSEEKVDAWFKSIPENDNSKRVGLILAGNIPMVGLHDLLCVLATGNYAVVKLSSSDDKLIPLMVKILVEIQPEIAKKIEFTDRLMNFDAVIATGSNNSSRYFDYYFGKVPHIIRKNRTSIAVISGNESVEELQNLGNDIFDYFGLGCRNVSKIYLPEGYEISKFFEAIEHFQPIINHFKYNNNYDYNKSIYLVNGVVHFDNGFLLVKEDSGFISPLAVLFYENYKSLEDLESKILNNSAQIQCIVGHANMFSKLNTVNFGKSQSPELTDYADNINTIEFLIGLNN